MSCATIRKVANEDGSNIFGSDEYASAMWLSLFIHFTIIVATFALVIHDVLFEDTKA